MENLTRQERHALEARLLEAAASGPRNLIPPLDDRSGPALLSPAQERFWFLDRLMPESPVYNTPWAFRLSGILHTEALRVSLNDLVRRHAVLRTVITDHEGQGRQRLQDPTPVSLSEMDLAHLPVDQREQRLTTILHQEAIRPFTLASDLMLRATLVHLDDREHVLLFVAHHVAFDGWSKANLHREVSEVYNATVQGRPSQLPSLPIQYVDFAVWQRAELDTEAMRRALSFWQEELRDPPPDLRLPCYGARPDDSDARADRVATRLEPELAKRLRSLAQGEQVTPTMVLLTVFMILLARYSGQWDMLVGMPVAGRPHADVESLIGPFINTLPLRGTLSGRPTFLEALHRVQETCLRAFEHQEVPFEEIVSHVSPDHRRSAFSPLIRAMLSMRNMPRAELQLDGIVASPVDVSTQMAKFDLILSLEEHAEGFSGEWTYRSSLLHTDVAEGIERNYRHLLGAAVDAPESPIDQLPLLDRAVRHRILEQWNRTEADLPGEGALHEHFEAVAEKMPKDVALTCGHEQATYQDVNARANAVAHDLIARGIAPGDRVAVCMGRSIEFVVAVLGILKAGAAYVPLDPSHPMVRLAYMLEDAEAAVLLTRSEIAEGLPHLPSCDVVCVDEGAERALSRSDVDPELNVDPEGPAYVMYTSGSAGSPKGVMVSHRGVVQLILGDRSLPLPPKPSTLLLASPTFDVSVHELWTALLHGGCCVIYADELPSLSGLSNIFRSRHIDMVHLPSAFFDVVIDQRPEILARVGLLLVGGEALSEAHVRRALFLLPQTQLVNAYGPTEAVVDACFYLIPRDLDPGLSTVPIGRPVGNRRIYIVDEHDQPVPIGVTGEILIGGPNLALGYLHQPGLTALSFTQDPFSDLPGDRVFRSGDLGRYLPDGRIEFLGRRDYQIKLRGFRIELEEIEATLRTHEDVRTAAAVLHRVSGGEKRLVGFVTGDSRLSPEALSLFLRERLPEFMVPSHVEILDDLPHTTSGKIDRKALLRRLDAVRHSKETAEPLASPPEAVENLTPTERRMTEIWGKVLGREPIDPQANFFDLGGHSLLALRLFSEIEKRFGCDLPIAVLFESPTVRSLCEVIDSAPDDVSSCLVPIQPRGTKPPLFLVHAGGGHVLFYKDLARRMGRDRPIYGLEAVGTRGAEPHRSIEAMAAHYVEEIERIVPQRGCHLGGSSMGGLIAFEMARILRQRGKPPGLVALFDTHIGVLAHEKPHREGRSLRSFRSRFTRVIGNLWRLPWTDKIFYVRAKSDRALLLIRWSLRRRLGPLLRRSSRGMSDSLSEQLKKTRDGIHTAFRSYLPAKLQGTVVLFRATQQIRGFRDDPTLGWGDRADEFRMHVIEGFHGDIVSEPAVGGLIGPLHEELERFDQEARQEDCDPISP